jgi:GTPase SAR1 family protein
MGKSKLLVIVFVMSVLLGSSIAQEVDNEDRIKGGEPKVENTVSAEEKENESTEKPEVATVIPKEPVIEAVEKLLIQLGASETFAQSITNILAPIFIIVSAILAFYGVRLKNININLKRRLFDPFFKLAEKSEVRTSNVLIIGDGGTGKTTLARALSGAEEVSPFESTRIRRTYVISKEFQGEDSSHIHRIYLEDYRGQNLPAFKKETEFPQRCAKSGGIVIFVVDLFYPVPEGEPVKQPEEQYCKKRVNDILREYSPNNVVQDISELCVDPLTHQNSCKMIILFINKFDLLIDHSDVSKQTVVKAYRKLITSITNNFNGQEPKIIVGSFDKGWGVTGPYKETTLPGSKSLYEYLMEASKSRNV